MIARYRKRPIEVEAMQWTGDNEAAIVTWTGPGVFYRIDEEDRPNLDDPDHTGDLFVAANSRHLGIPNGEWIIRDSAGFYPCKADIFAATYEEV